MPQTFKAHLDVGPLSDVVDKVCQTLFHHDGSSPGMFALKLQDG